MALELTGPRAAVETVLFGQGADECMILRKPPDPTTFDAGTYDIPAPIVIYEGVCSLKASQSNLSGRAEQGAVTATLQRWTVKLPLLATVDVPPRPGDIVIMTVSRDSVWLGERFVIRDVGGGTNSVLRSCAMDRWAPGSGEDWARSSP